MKQKIGFGTWFAGETGMQRFQHEDKWREIHFAEQAPSLSEFVGGALLAACFVGVMFGFLWA